MVLYVKLKYVHYFGYATYTDLMICCILYCTHLMPKLKTNTNKSETKTFIAMPMSTADIRIFTFL